jgi:hypothetical protein
MNYIIQLYFDVALVTPQGMVGSFSRTSLDYSCNEERYFAGGLACAFMPETASLFEQTLVCSGTNHCLCGRGDPYRLKIKGNDLVKRTRKKLREAYQYGEIPESDYRRWYDALKGM